MVCLFDGLHSLGNQRKTQGDRQADGRSHDRSVVLAGTHDMVSKSGPNSACQVASCRPASSTAQMSSGVTSPAASATGLNSAGPGCEPFPVMRISASMPTSSSLMASTMGWYSTCNCRCARAC